MGRPLSFWAGGGALPQAPAGDTAPSTLTLRVLGSGSRETQQDTQGCDTERAGQAQQGEEAEGRAFEGRGPRTHPGLGPGPFLREPRWRLPEGLGDGKGPEPSKVWAPAVAFLARGQEAGARRPWIRSWSTGRLPPCPCLSFPFCRMGPTWPHFLGLCGNKPQCVWGFSTSCSLGRREGSGPAGLSGPQLGLSGSLALSPFSGTHTTPATQAATVTGAPESHIRCHCCQPMACPETQW